MDVKQAYDHWSKQYDTNINLTRDLEAIAFRTVLTEINFDTCLEMGCGTGKNTEWLANRTKQITAVDLSNEMLTIAKEKIKAANVQFRKADILREWDFINEKYDLVSFSLVLEHIENLNSVFNKVSKVLNKEGHVYIGELHPFKQYTGSKARFETNEGVQAVTCFNHHLSDFIHAAKNNGLSIADINEYFDNNDRTSVPRILTLLLKNNQPVE